jgi:thioredoxin-like negative regulator of GroEL
MLAREVYPTEKFKAQSKYFVFCKINADRQPAVFQQFGVSAMPTLLFLNNEGAELHKFLGFKPVDAFIGEMNKARGASN